MRSGLIVEKVGMSSMFTDSGEKVALTFLQLQDCIVVDHRTEEKNGYNALVLGSGSQKPSKLTKSMKQVFANLKVDVKAKLKEFRISKDSFIDIGTKFDASYFTIGQSVDVTGVSVGKGFAGGMKRWNFAGLEASHGVSISHRSHGSTGGRQDPGRVFKNKKMAGHMGSRRVTLQNLQIINVDTEKNLIMVKGSVPGHKGSYVYIKDAVKKG